MDPSTLEMLVMLRFNKDLWDTCEVDEAMKRTTNPEVEIAEIAPASSYFFVLPLLPLLPFLVLH